MRDELLALAALAFILGVTVVWWAVALWPVSSATPAWVQATRAICFGAHAEGLPSAGGWILLVGEPIGMTIALFVLWRDPLLSGLARLLGGAMGRCVIALVMMATLAGAAGVGWRVMAAGRTSSHGPDGAGGLMPLRRVPGSAPRLALVDQHGETLTLERFRGREVLVTFAFAHCETVCPLLVRNAQRARRRFEPAPVLVVVTLDPWRDLPSRLPSIATAWRMGGDEFVVSGEVDAVLRTLHEWRAAGARDPRTGDVVHAPLTYVLDREGRIAFVTGGETEVLVRAVGDLR